MFSISNTTRARIPRIPFKLIKEEVLGKEYELSLVFIGEKRSQTLNKKFRGKDKPTNVLSFPLSKTFGEIFITPSVSEPFGIGKLFIHGLLHLKGMSHGRTMDKTESKLVHQYLDGTTHRSRHRHRDI